jgi:hypothetical protein
MRRIHQVRGDPEIEGCEKNAVGAASGVDDCSVRFGATSFHRCANLGNLCPTTVHSCGRCIASLSALGREFTR